MRLKSERVYHGLILFFACLLFWSVWAHAQTTNNPAATDAPVAAPASEGESSLYLTFGLNRVAFLQRTLLDFPLYQYLASLIYIFLAFYLSKLVDHVFRVYLKRWAAGTRTRLDDVLINVANGPVKTVCFVVLLHIGLNAFPWPTWIERTLHHGLTIIVAGSLIIMVVRIVDSLSEHWMGLIFRQEDATFRQQLLPIVRQSLRVFVIVIGILLTAQNLNLEITALLGSLGVVGLALSLASKDTVENIFGAVAVFMDKPFKVGDRIKLDSVEGTVETIGIRSTRVRNLDGHLITVPNKTVGNATITNITMRPNFRTVMNIGVTYNTPPDKVQQALQLIEEVCKAHPMTADVIVGFDQFADSSLNLRVIHWCGTTDYKIYLRALQEINLEVKRRFDAADISFAFPTRTVYLKQDSDWKFDARSLSNESGA